MNETWWKRIHPVCNDVREENTLKIRMSFKLPFDIVIDYDLDDEFVDCFELNLSLRHDIMKQAAIDFD